LVQKLNLYNCEGAIRRIKYIYDIMIFSLPVLAYLP